MHMFHKIATGSGTGGNDLQELKNNSEKQDFVYTSILIILVLRE